MDRQCCRELVDTPMEDFEEISSAHKSKLRSLQAELDHRGPVPLGTEVEYVQLRSQVVGLEDELTNLTQRVATLDNTWDEERVALQAGKAETSSKADGLAMELVQAKAYIHSTLSIEYGQDGDEPSEMQLAFRCLQTKLAEREEALRVATTEVGTLRALLETGRQGSTSNSTIEKELVHL